MRRWVSIMTVTVMLASLLTACGNSGGATIEKVEETSSAAAVGRRLPVLNLRRLQVLWRELRHLAIIISVS